MKKIIVLFFVFVFALNFALAQQERIGNRSDEMPEPNQISEGQGNRDLITPRSDNGTKEQEIERNQTGPVMMIGNTTVHTGLNNALSKVKNENARQRLQINMERFLDRYQNKIGNMSGVEIEINEEDETIKIKEEKDVKFFGFINGKATKTYKIDKEGDIREKHPWYRFMYAES